MSRPNIVFVFADQMRQMSMSCMGADPVATPRLDAFVAESRNLTQACSNNPVCSPYRACLLTGKYPMGNQVLSNPTPERGVVGRCFLREEERCLSDVLFEAGYGTGYIGKWHLDAEPYTPPGPARHGFTFWHVQSNGNLHLTPKYWVNEAPPDNELAVEKWSVEHETDVAISFIENAGGGQRATDKPFALIVSYNPPHHPYDYVPERYSALYRDASKESLLTRPNVTAVDGPEHRAWRSVANYYAAVTGVDEQFGRILDCLKRQGIEEDTIVVFSSDHGEMMGSHGLMHKGIWYDEAFLVPFVIRWPGHIRPGDDPVLLNTPDIFPTLLSLAGEGSRLPAGVEGMDLAPHLLGEPGSRTPEFQPYYQTSHARPAGGRRGLRTERHTYLESRTEGEPAVILHDRLRDPYEQRNAADDAPEVCRELHEKLMAWLEKTQDPWLSGPRPAPSGSGDANEQLARWLREQQQRWITPSGPESDGSLRSGPAKKR